MFMVGRWDKVSVKHINLVSMSISNRMKLLICHDMFLICNVMTHGLFAHQKLGFLFAIGGWRVPCWTHKKQMICFFGGISTNRLTEFNRTNTVILKWEVNEVNGIPSGFFKGDVW